jgi:acyl-coenzyme A synthetase/AMP-(fatty) acid ligase
VCFTDAFFAPVIDRVREAVGLKHVVMIGDGDTPHDAKYEDVLAAATPRLPDEPEEDEPVVLMYTGGTTDCRKACYSITAPRCSTLYHVMATWRFDEHDSFLQPDADVPRGVDGRHVGSPRGGGHVGVLVVVRSGPSDATQ